MGKIDWYRRTSWTAADQADFAARLARSRTVLHKAQYLRIQALHLHQVGTPELTAAALRLLEQLVTKFPDSSQLALAQEKRGQCLIDLGRSEEAIAALREAIEAQRAHPNIHTHAHLDYAELVLSLRREELYETAWSLLDEFGYESPFPADRYRIAAVWAQFLEYRGDLTAAARWAEKAVSAAGLRESPFARHRCLGLVGDIDPDIWSRLTRLAALSGEAT